MIQSVCPIGAGAFAYWRVRSKNSVIVAMSIPESLSWTIVASYRSARFSDNERVETANPTGLWNRRTLPVDGKTLGR